MVEGRERLGGPAAQHGDRLAPDTNADCWRLADAEHRQAWRKVQSPYGGRRRWICAICHPENSSDRRAGVPPWYPSPADYHNPWAMANLTGDSYYGVWVKSLRPGELARLIKEWKESERA